MIHIPDDATYFKLPRQFVCPHCGRCALWCEIDEWEVGSGIPTETGIHVSCRNERRGDGHWQYPYCTLMPLEHQVYEWVRQHVRIVESEAKLYERLRAWNMGEPIRGEA